MAPTLVTEFSELFLNPKGKPMSFSPLSTPQSQASTAPPTPVLSLLPDTHEERGGKFVRTTSGASTQVPEEAADYSEGEEVERKDSNSVGASEGVLSFGLPRLQSELGRWAEAVVKAEEWLEDEWRKQRHASSSSARKEYLVDNSDLRADTVGLAFRCSKNLWDREHEISGPMWGETVAGLDQGDGWVKVGEHFLPMELDGMTVLTQRVEALRDGPSLTADGIALDLELGGTIYFSHDKALADSSEIKAQLKEEHRMIRSERLARAAREAEARLLAGAICSIDATGVVRGFTSATKERGEECKTASRLKKFHRRRQARRRHGEACGTDRNPALCAGPDGKVFLFLTLEDTAENYERLHRKRAMLRRPEVIADEDTDCAPMVIDAHGVVHL